MFLNHPQYYERCVSWLFSVTGETLYNLPHQFRVGYELFSSWFLTDIKRLCCLHSIWVVVQRPDTAEEGKQVADGFRAQWNFPNCLRALDRKHSSKSRHSSSTVLMAVVDSGYRLLHVDVGFSGWASDGRSFGGRSLQDALRNWTLNIPAPAPLPLSDRLVPCCIVADEAIPLRGKISWSHIQTTA